MTTLLSLPPGVLQILTTLINLRDLLPLRLLSRKSYTIFAGPTLCSFLLTHNFPFASPPLRSEAYTILNTLLLCRRRILTSSYTQVVDLPPIHHFDADLGTLLSTTTDNERNRLEIAIRRISSSSGGSTLLVPAPLRLGASGPHPEVLLQRDRVLLLYPGSLAMLLSAREARRTLWSQVLSLPVFTDCTSLQPVFNEHYLAFLTGVAPGCVLAIIGFSEQLAEPVVSSLKIRGANICMLRSDEAGALILVGEVYPGNGNLHRVVLVDAVSGTAVRAVQLMMAPMFSDSPRDWGFELAPDGDFLLAWQSPRDETYRVFLALQVSVIPLRGGGGMMVRYLQAGEVAVDMSELSYNFALNVATVGGNVLVYPPLKLESRLAGSGEWTNRFNTLKPQAVVAVAMPERHHPVRTVRVGREWVCAGFQDAGGNECVRALRMSTATSQRLESPASGRSARTTSEPSTPQSIGMETTTVVDAEELSKRLVDMQVKGKGKARGSGLRYSQVYSNESFEQYSAPARDFSPVASPPGHEHERKWGFTGITERVSGALRRRKGKAHEEDDVNDLGSWEVPSKRWGWKGKLF